MRKYLWKGCQMWALPGFLFFLAAFFIIMTETRAAVPSQITDYKPQVTETHREGTVTNSKGEEVKVTITHPGVGMTKKELDNMRDHVRAGDEPWTSAFHAFAAHDKSKRNPRIFYEMNDDFVWVPNVWTNSARKEYVTIRGNKDGMTAVNQAIMWYITGDDVYRGNCMNVIRLWSRIQSITPEKDFRWGITSYNLAFAAEIMRYSDCETEAYRWTEEDTENFNRYLNNALEPSRYTKAFWMNQQSFANMGIISTAIFQDNFDLYAQGVEQTTVNSGNVPGGNNGSIKYQCRLMTVNEETGEQIPEERQRVQLIEAGRDQGHAWATSSGLSTLAQSMYVQGTLVDPETGEISNDADAVNLFNFLDDRLLKGVTAALRYNLGYDDEWITADSSRGFYREPSEDSWRGRINPCLGILYNYYRYIENQDMTEDKFKDIARAYERYMPEVTSSDDFPLAATLLYTPTAAKDNYTKREWYPETTYHKEIENFTGDISGHPQIKTEGNVNYVQMSPGAEVVCGFGWPAEGGMGIRVRSDGAAKIEVRRDRKTNAPKAVFQVPDTKGEWVTVTCNTAGTSYGNGDFVYFKVLGDVSHVDLDYVDFTCKEAPETTISCNTNCVEDIEEGKTIYMVPAGQTAEFRVRSDQDGAVFYVDSTMRNCRADNIKGVMTVKPVQSECGKEQHIYLTMQKGGLVSVTEIIVKPYSKIEDILEWYAGQYHPDTAEYTAVSKKAYEDAKRALTETADAGKQQAAQAYVDAFRGLQGLLASYDFETVSAGNMVDGSGNRNDGKLCRNAEVTDDSEKKSKVLTLDGSINTYAELPKGLLNGCDEFTISFDVKPDMVEGNFFTYAIGTDTINYSYLKTLNEQLVLRTTKYSNGAEQGAIGNINACQGKWMNIKAVYEKDKVSLYADNVFVGAEDVSLKLSDCGNDLSFYLGKSFWLWDLYYSGSFDNVKVYNYAMEKEDIDGSERQDLTVTYIIGDGAQVKGESVQTVKYGESASKITLVPYKGYSFKGWSDGNANLSRQEKYITKDVTLYARFQRKADTESAIASYDFEESQGKAVRDVSGNGNYLELFGNARLKTDGERGKVLYLDGSTGTYAEFPQGLLDNQNVMTITMDVKATKANMNANYWVMGIGQDNQKYYMLKTNETNIKSALTKASYQNEFSVMPEVTAEIKNQWRSITVVIDETSMRVYLDGTLLEEKTDATVKISDFGTDLKAYLGKSFFEADEYFEGYLDNVCIYNYAMTEEEATGSAGRNLTLQYTAGTGGNIEGEASQSVAQGGTGSTVTAVAETGYRFVSWSDGRKEAARTDFNVRNCLSVSALFEREKITASQGLVADYEMAYSQGGILSNKASLTGRLDAKLVNMTQEDFGKDGMSEVMKFAGDVNKYVELPQGLVGDDETFSIETVFQTNTKANHWLYTLGNIADGANYLFINPMAPDGKLLAAVKDQTSEYRVSAGTTAVSEDYHMLTLTFDRGTVCIYLDGDEVARKSTGYHMRDILRNGTTGGICGFIGKSLYAADPAFTGNVASFKVFDCVLDSGRVKQRYEGKETESYVEASEEKALKYYLSFDAENLEDGSGNNRTSVLRHKENGKTSYVAGRGNEGKALRLNKSDTKTAILASQADGLVKDSMTVSFWLKVPEGGFASEQGILSFASEEGDSLEVSAAASNDGTDRAVRVTFAGQGSEDAVPYYTEVSAEESFPAGEWVQITVVMKDGIPSVYRNGESLALTQGGKKRSVSVENGCWIGAGWNDAGEQTYLTALLDDFKVYNYPLDLQDIQESNTVAVKKKIAAFTFDDEKEGLKGGGAKATVNGNITIVEDEVRGKVLSLDGTGSGYLSVTSEQGENLLKGLDELTISYYSKPGRAGANWSFYAAPNTNVQQNANPTYLGVIDNNVDITVERHNSGRKENCKAGSNGEWKHVVVVYQAETVKLYINGVFQSMAANAESLQKILGQNSVLQIGKANWGDGEYYQGLLDDYSIYNYAMTESQVQGLEQPETVEKEMFVVSYEASQGGKIQGSTVQQVENGKDGSKVTAVAAEGYEFIQWSDGLKTETRNESNVTENHYYRAWFTKKQKIAYFSFDDEAEGLQGNGAQGMFSGSLSFSEDAIKGKSLSLDGISDFIRVVGKEGESLLDGLETMTISFYSKPLRSGNNWVLYGTGNIEGKDSYVGISDGTEKIQAVRSLNGYGETAETLSSGDWKHIVVVLDADAVKIYVNGKLRKSVSNSSRLAEILGEDGILQIGKADLENGEYYQGLLDELSIYNFALTEEQILGLESGIEIENSYLVCYVAGRGGRIEGKAGQVVMEGGTTETVTAVAAEGYEFVQWSDGKKEAERSDSGIGDNLTFTAEFRRLKVGKIAEFSLTDEGTGLRDLNAVASASGILTFVSDEEKGNVLSFDGSGSSYLEVKSASGSSLLTDMEELTISYNSKPLREGANWTFYAAPNAEKQTDQPTYVGISDGRGEVFAERHKNGRKETAKASALDDGWKHVTTVFAKDKVEVYINGVLAATGANAEDISEILGDSSIFYIGKANLEDGEGYQGLLSDYVIYDTALTAEEIRKAEITRPLAEKLKMAKSIGKGNYTDDSYEKLQTAIRAAEEIMTREHSQEEVEETLRQIQEAISGLKEEGSAGKEISVTGINVSPETVKMEVGQKLRFSYKVQPENADNKDVTIASNDKNIVTVSGETITAVGAGKATITITANDGSGVNGKITVTVCMNAVDNVKVTQNAKKAYAVVSWNTVSESKGYIIYRSSKPKSGYKKIASISALKHKYIDKKVKPGKKYYYKVRVRGNSAVYDSSLSKKYGNIYVLKRPVLKVKKVNGKSVSLSWKKVKGASGYVIYQSANNKKYKKVKTLKKVGSVRTVIKVKKKVYFKMRPYKLVKGKKVYGTYSKAVSVRMK